MLQEQYQRHLLRYHESELVSGIRNVQPLLQYFETSLVEQLLGVSSSLRQDLKSLNRAALLSEHVGIVFASAITHYLRGG